MKGRIVSVCIALGMLMSGFGAAASEAAASEAAASEAVYAYYRPGEYISETEIFKGDFDGDLTQWVTTTGKWEGDVSLTESDRSDGGSCLKLTKAGSGSPGVYHTGFVPAEGMEYEISALLKKEAGIEGASFNKDVGFKIEYYGENGNLGVEGHAAFGDIPADNSWYYVNAKIAPPEGCTGVVVYARLFAKGTVYFDDITCHALVPAPVFFETDNIFYYTDVEQGLASACINPAAGETEITKIRFILEDGNENPSATVDVTDGKATFSFPLSALRTIQEQEAGYTVRCICLGADGTAVYETEETVYRTARPSALRADGTYIKDGAPFVPVVGYHVANGKDPSLFPHCKDAGINVIQMLVSDAKTEAGKASIKERLDAMAENGLMAFVGLYSSMERDAQEAIIDYIVAYEEARKNENKPAAVFGYMLVDEPTLNGVSPEYLTALYKLVRTKDAVRPAYICESPLTSYNYRAVGKRTDILAVDPYAGSAEKMCTYVSAHVTMGKKAVDYKKPVYCINEIMTKNWSPSPDDVRNMHYQALLSGADALGYYDVQDVYGYKIVVDSEGNKSTEKEHMWERDGYPGVLRFAKNEASDAFAAFIRKEYDPICENTEGDVWWKCFGDENEIYCVVLNRTNAVQETEIENIRVGDFTEVSVLGGIEETEIAAESVLSVRLPARGTAVFRLSFRYAENGGECEVQLSYGGERTQELQDGTARLICDSGRQEGVAFLVTLYRETETARALIRSEIYTGRLLDTEITVPADAEICKVYIWEKGGSLVPVECATVFCRGKET